MFLFSQWLNLLVIAINPKAWRIKTKYYDGTQARLRLQKKSVPVSTVKVKCEGRQNCIIDNHDLAYCKHNVTTYEFQYVDQLLQH